MAFAFSTWPTASLSDLECDDPACIQLNRNQVLHTAVWLCIPGDRSEPQACCRIWSRISC